MANDTNTKSLRILAADEDEETLKSIDVLLADLGHTVVAHAVKVSQAGDLIASEDPDLSVVVVHDDDEHALDLIEEICEYARGPLIVLLAAHDSSFVRSAAERGIDAFARPQFEEEVQGAIELARKRHGEKLRLTEQIEQLESALGRRGVIERAKGILMERHGVGERAAFELMREQARRSNRRVVELAHAVVDGHALLPNRAE
ncbi:MAG TPA: ANTAR domain-containing protein [Solirubrobacteraceae bacterium]|nr:ANTAR domain-containing protein [Solirubrobacteraceae bacterium]